MNSTTERDIDEILLKFAKDLRFIDEERVKHKIGTKEEANARAGSHNKAKQAIQAYYEKLMLDVIGEDENTVIDYGHDCYEKNCSYCENAIRDELRTNLRDKLKS